MNRRNFVQTAGLGGLLACLPGNTAVALVDEMKTSPGTTSVETDIYRLKLRHPWTTTMSSSTYRDIRYVHYGDPNGTLPALQDYAGMHGFHLLQHHGGRSSVSACRLRGSRRQPACRE
jgi:hypothetical protein